MAVDALELDLHDEQRFEPSAPFCPLVIMPFLFPSRSEADSVAAKGLSVSANRSAASFVLPLIGLVPHRNFIDRKQFGEIDKMLGE